MKSPCTWFAELLEEARRRDHLMPDFPTQAVRVRCHRKALPDVYERHLGEECGVTYLRPYLERSQGIVDAPVAIYDGGYLAPVIEPN